MSKELMVEARCMVSKATTELLFFYYGSERIDGARRKRRTEEIIR